MFPLKGCALNVMFFLVPLFPPREEQNMFNSVMRSAINNTGGLGAVIRKGTGVLPGVKCECHKGYSLYVVRSNREDNI